MNLVRPTLQGRIGYDPYGYGPGVSAPFGYSKNYVGFHHGMDCFWLNSGSAIKYNITVAQSKDIYPVMDGTLYPIDSVALGIGAWQQIDDSHRFYYWHMSKRINDHAVAVDTVHRLGVMGDSGTATTQVHLHAEVRKYPYRDIDRIDPEPFFGSDLRSGSLVTLAQANQLSGWLARPYNTKAYWIDLQTQGNRNGFYTPVPDGIPGPLTFRAEKLLWEKFVAPKPVVVPDPIPEPTPNPIPEPAPNPIPEPEPDKDDNMNNTPAVPTETPNVVIEDPKVRKIVRTVIDVIGGLVFIAIAVDVSAREFDISAFTIPVMTAYTAARVVFGFAVDNTNTPK